MKAYILKLKENKRIGRLLHTTKNPFAPKLKVLCRFYRKGIVDERMLEVEQPKWYFEPIRSNGIIVGKKLIIEHGFITLKDKQEKYLAQGTPPLIYRSGYVEPCPTWAMDNIPKKKGQDTRCP